jgi:hypothetical protein
VGKYLGNEQPEMHEIVKMNFKEIRFDVNRIPLTQNNALISKLINPQLYSWQSDN